MPRNRRRVNWAAMRGGAVGMALAASGFLVNALGWWVLDSRAVSLIGLVAVVGGVVIGFFSVLRGISETIDVRESEERVPPHGKPK
jgi:hypothetical protein